MKYDKDDKLGAFPSRGCDIFVSKVFPFQPYSYIYWECNISVVGSVQFSMWLVTVNERDEGRCKNQGGE